MKNLKIIAVAILTAVFMFSYSYAGPRLGLTGAISNFDASGQEKLKTTNAITKKSESGTFGYASIFLEADLPNGIVVGVDVIPYSAKIGDGGNVDSRLEPVEMTILYMFKEVQIE